MKRRIVLPFIVAGCLLCVSGSEFYLPQKAVIAEEKPNGQQTKDELTNITKIVKGKISIPLSMTEFDYSSDNKNSNLGNTWYFHWREKDGKNSIDVESDQKGNILRYDSYLESDEKYQPKFKKSELIGQAESFIQKTAPELAGHYQFKTSKFNGVYSGSYSFYFERIENKIPFPDNFIRVDVNYDNKKVMSYQAKWEFSLSVPAGNARVTKEEAIEKIKKEVTMKLGYYTSYDKEGKNKETAFLAYYPDQTYIGIDGKTGAVYKTKNAWNQGELFGNTKEESVRDAGADAGLTKEEIKKIEEIGNIISEEKAIQIVKSSKNLLLDENLTTISSRLYKMEGTGYVWSIDFSNSKDMDAEGKDTYQGFASAEIDAKTGKFLSYYAGTRNYNQRNEEDLKNITVKYNENQGKTILETFIKEQIPDYYKHSALSSNEEINIIGYKKEVPIYGGYSYQYDRIYNKIPYKENRIYGSVDGITGKITSFGYHWNPSIRFQEANHIISPEKAFDSYMNLEGFGLRYEMNGKQKVGIEKRTSVENEIRFVYSTNIEPYFISPFTGKQLNYQGDVYQLEQDAYSYSDINDHWAKESIELLADMEIGFTGGKFLPDTAITPLEFNQFLSVVRTRQIYENNKIDTNKLNLTRLEAAKYAVTYLGYSNIADISNIYKTDFADSESISSKDLGYVAIAQGFKLIKGDSKNNFNQDQFLTRAEAAYMVFSMLGI